MNITHAQTEQDIVRVSPSGRCCQMGSRLSVQNLLSSRPSDSFLGPLGATGALHPLVLMAAPRTVWRIQAARWLGGALRALDSEPQDRRGVVPGWRGAEEFLDPSEAEHWAATLRDEVAVGLLG